LNKILFILILFKLNKKNKKVKFPIKKKLKLKEDLNCSFMKKYASRKCHRGKLAFRTPRSFISQKVKEVEKWKLKKR
jgi:hypothetical protein